MTDSSATKDPASQADVTAGERDEDLKERLTLELIEFVQWHERAGVKWFTPRQILEAFWTCKTISDGDEE